MFFSSSSPSMILATIDFFSFSDFTALQLKFVCVTPFVVLLGKLGDLPHSKNDFCFQLMTFNFSINDL